MSDGKLHIGYSMKNNEEISLPLKTLKRHFAALGASGSGKTVFVKAVLEECVREGVPLVLIDIQGDLASIALMGDKNTVEAKGTPKSYWDDVQKQAQVAIFTPASTKGIPISMNPLKEPPENLEHEDFIQAVDSVAEAIASILGYNTDKGKGKDVHSYLYLLLEAIWEKGRTINSFTTLANIMLEDTEFLDQSAISILKEKDKDELIKQVRSLTIGTDSLIFNLGMPLDIERMMTWADPGKTPVNVLYLNTIRDEDTKRNFIADIANQTYNFMLRNPSEEVQLVFLLDELAGLVPPIGNPPTKKSIQLLLKQARKYGVSLLLATQNITDVDYKSLGQVGTWALGRFMAKQDIEKVRAIIEAISPNEVEKITSELRRLKTGQFMLLAPDVYDQVQFMRVRWLVTNHITLDEEKVKRIMDESGIRNRFPEPNFKRRKPDEPEENEQTLEEELQEDQLIKTKDELTAIPKMSEVKDLEKTLEDEPIVLSIEDISYQLDLPEKESEKLVQTLLKENKLEKEEIEGVTLYWSKKHEMDPSRNIVGPLFRAHLEIPKGKAESIVDKNIPKDLWKKREIIVDNKTKLFYLPLWRISTVEIVTETRGGGLFKKKIAIQKEVKVVHYVNGLTGEITHLEKDKKETSLLFKKSGIQSKKDINPLGKEIKFEKEVLSGLTAADTPPKLNREQAKKELIKLLGAHIDKDTISSIVWFPIWSFTKWDEAKQMNSYAWVEGIFGTYYEDNPLN